MNASSSGVASVHMFAETDLHQTLTVPFGTEQCCLFTSASAAKGRNEDVVAAVDTSERSGVLIVADGVGGLPNGEIAARIAVESVVESLNDSVDVIRDAILNGIETANARILGSGTGGACTLAVVEVDKNNIRPYHVGDPLVLVTGQRGRLKFQNIAHSPVGYAVESGILDEDEAAFHDERNIVSNVVGDSDMHIAVGPLIELAPRDTVLVSSDGVGDNLYVQEIVDAVRVGSLESCGEHLVSVAKRRMAKPEPGFPSHPDDLSFILFRSKLERRHSGHRKSGTAQMVLNR